MRVNYVVYVIGVVAGILSSCCPLAMLAWIIAPALAAGNTVCLRPSKQTPLPAMLLAHIAIEAGLPAGVLNVLPGGSDVAQQLLLHNVVAHITFSGRTSIGRQIVQATAGCPKKLTMCWVEHQQKPGQVHTRDRRLVRAKTNRLGTGPDQLAPTFVGWKCKGW
uniref:(California timema) hypothetical protein n=1 Tax=Timema californicum TaxID=61474 RepID=A0A7R9JJE1_TIMCA|nr:unnamed protein product [Timema californicum]